MTFKQICLLLPIVAIASSWRLPGQVVYVADHDANSVSAFSINGATGALTAIPGSPFATVHPTAVAVHASGKFVYAVNDGGTVSAYTVNPASGALTPAPGSPFPAVSQQSGGTLALDPGGKFVFVNNNYYGSSSVSVFSINPASGALTAAAGSPFPTTTSIPVAVHPSGKFLYLDGYGLSGNGIAVYSVDGVSGALRAVAGSPFRTTQSTGQFVVDPAGKFLYVAGTDLNGAGFVSTYAIDGTSGALTAASSRPVNAFNLVGMAMDSSGKFLYLTESFNTGILAFAVNPATGTLTPAPGSPFSLAIPSGFAAYPDAVAVDPTGKFVYVTAVGQTAGVAYPPLDGIAAYAINPANGAITPVPGTATRTPQGPVAIAVHNLPAAPAPPTITLLAPSATTAGGAAFTLAVTGTGFLSGAVVQWNGAALSTTFVNATQLSAAAPANLIAAVGSANITVANPDGTVSKGVSFAINPVVISISASGVVNGASLAGGAVSAGEVVNISGAGFSASAQALFDGVTAPLISAKAGQLVAVVPYEVDGNAATQLQVSDQGQTSSAVAIPVAAAAPGIFTVDGSGSGQGSIANDDGSANAPGNAAPAGSTVMVMATGGGQTNPAGVDGATADPAAPAPVPLLPVTATVGGEDAPATASGAPGMIAGYLLVSVQIPPDAATGDAVPIVVTIGGVSSQAGVTVAVE